MTITSSLRFLYIFGGFGLLCAVRAAPFRAGHRAALVPAGAIRKNANFLFTLSALCLIVMMMYRLFD